MSITDLKALAESWLIEARKLPAAPALESSVSVILRPFSSIEQHLHGKIKSSQLVDTTLDGIIQAVKFAHIHGPNADDFGTRTDRGNVLSYAFGLLDISTDDTRISA